MFTQCDGEVLTPHFVVVSCGIATTGHRGAHVRNPHTVLSWKSLKYKQKLGGGSGGPVAPNITFCPTKRTRVIAACRDLSCAQNILQRLSRAWLIAPSPAGEAYSTPTDLLADFEQVQIQGEGAHLCTPPCFRKAKTFFKYLSFTKQDSD